MATLAAVLGTAIVFCGAYLIEKGRGYRAGRALAHLLAMLPMAVPGLVLGLGYAFFINARWNPLGVLYGTILLLAINSVAAHGGGLAAVADGEVLAQMALPIAGILSDRPLSEVATAYGALEDAAHSLGSDLPSPFGLLAFMALSVIPGGRVTDKGFVRIG